MRVWPIAYIQGLAQTGPPPGANNVRFEVKDWYKVPTLANLRSIESDKKNEQCLVILLGEIAPYDGLLQGIYDYVPEGLQNARVDDGASWIIVNDGKSAWMKIT